MTTQITSPALLTEVTKVTEFIYTILEELPEEERWGTTSKLRQAANDLLFTVAQALGNSSPTSTEYEWGQAGKNALSLQTMYRFAGRQKFIKIDPDIMLQLESIRETIDKESKAAYKKTAQLEAKEIASWHEKYKLWKAAKEGK